MVWMIPTLSRPEKMQRLLNSMSDTDKAEDFVVIYWDRDPRLKHYVAVDYPAHWRQAITPCEWVRDKVNWMFSEYPNESFYSGLSDDILLVTRDMLKPWREHTTSWELSWCQDNWASQTMAAHPAIGGELARSIAKAQGGFLAHPKFPHYGHEMVMFWIAQELGLLKWLPQFVYDCPHPLRGAHMRHEDDETYRKCRKINQASFTAYNNFPRADLLKMVDSVRADFYRVNGIMEKRTARNIMNTANAAQT